MEVSAGSPLKKCTNRAQAEPSIRAAPLARVLNRASLRGFDRFFVPLRRRVSLAERPIATARPFFGFHLAHTHPFG
jgi:hypothetical protein